MAPPTGLEPVTSWLTVMRSTNWAMEEYGQFDGSNCIFCSFLTQIMKRNTCYIDQICNLTSFASTRVFILKTHWWRHDAEDWISNAEWCRNKHRFVFAKNREKYGYKCRQRLIFPGRFQPSIFSTDELNCRVRNGNGWTLIVTATDCIRILLCVSTDLFSRAASSRVSSALMSLTAVFGMGTGGPSSLQALTFGAPSGIRTRDPLIKSQLLYQLS